MSKSRSSSAQTQQTNQEDTDLTAIGTDGNVIKGQTVTVNESFPTEVAQGLIDLAGQVIGGAGQVVDRSVQAVERSQDTVAEIKSESQAPQNTMIKYIIGGLVVFAIAGTVILTNRRK